MFYLDFFKLQPVVISHSHQVVSALKITLSRNNLHFNIIAKNKRYLFFFRIRANAVGIFLFGKDWVHTNSKHYYEHVRGMNTRSVLHVYWDENANRLT